MSVSRRRRRDAASDMQLDFAWTIPVAPEFDHKPTTAERFAAFHALNPHVYAALLNMTRQLWQRGHKRVGIRMLWEILRWRTMMVTAADESGYKLNDHYTRHYARLIMQQEPELSGIFEMRERAS